MKDKSRGGRNRSGRRSGKIMLPAAAFFLAGMFSALTLTAMASSFPVSGQSKLQSTETALCAGTSAPDTGFCRQRWSRQAQRCMCGAEDGIKRIPEPAQRQERSESVRAGNGSFWNRIPPMITILHAIRSMMVLTVPVISAGVFTMS